MSSIDGLFRSFQISASGMSAQRVKLNVASANIANVETTRTEEGGPYRRQKVVFSARNDTPIFIIPEPTVPEGQIGSLQLKGTSNNLLSTLPWEEEEPIGPGVKVEGIVEDKYEPKMIYNPEHPDANGDGYVLMPNINIATEMVDVITASRAYEANVTTFNAAKSMALKAIDIGKA